jgi:hypothetical protein
MSIEPTMHPFEVAGLGKAPFRYAGMIDQDRCYGQAILNREEYERTGILVTTVPGGSCDYCGTYIVDMFKVRSADGKTFKVGCDCIGKLDPQLAEEISADVRKLQRAKRAATKARKLATVADMLADTETREAIAARPHPIAARAANGATLLDWCGWMMAHSGAAGKSRVLAAIKAALAAPVPERAPVVSPAERFAAQCDATPGLAEALACGHPVCADLAAKGQQYGSLSDKQIAFALRLAREAAEVKPARAVPAAWTVGERATLTATYERSVCLEGRGYRGGNKWGHTFRDAASGVALTWWTDGKGAGAFSDDETGARITTPWRIVATVEKIGEYKGEPQVTIARAKVAPVDPVAALAEVLAAHFAGLDMNDAEAVEDVREWRAKSFAELYCEYRWGMREVCDHRAAFALAFPSTEAQAA